MDLFKDFFWTYDSFDNFLIYGFIDKRIFLIFDFWINLDSKIYVIF
jgi:hypothetical protein